MKHVNHLGGKDAQLLPAEAYVNTQREEPFALKLRVASQSQLRYCWR